MTTKTEQTTQRAIEDIERLAADAVAALRQVNPRLASKVEERADAVGVAQAGAELAYAALAAVKSPARPDGLELAIDNDGWDTQRGTDAQRSARTMARRIKDAQ